MLGELSAMHRLMVPGIPRERSQGGWGGVPGNGERRHPDDDRHHRRFHDESKQLRHAVTVACSQWAS